MAHLTATIEEAGSISASGSANWWVSSGARFVCQQGVGTTLQGTLPSDDTWRTAYASSNPLDTEDGYRPQNVFRMVTRGEWEDLDQQVSFRIQRTNLTDSPNRDAWNGVQLFHRYLDENNLYILGVRVDGVAAIKKKRNGVYTTLGYKKLYAGTYDRWARPNLLPQGTWVGIRGVSTTTDHGTVMLRIEVNDPALGSGWTPVIETEDTASDAIATPGHGGIRADFMEVQFDSYSAGPAGASSPTPTPTSPSLPSPTPTPSTPLPTPTPTPTPSAPQPTPTPTAPPASTPTPAAASCTITLSPLSQWFGSTGGGGTVAVVTSSSCSWTAVSDRSWIKIVLGSFGTGNGIVTYEVGATRKRTRSGAIHVGDVAFTITQSR